MNIIFLTLARQGGSAEQVAKGTELGSYCKGVWAHQQGRPLLVVRDAVWPFEETHAGKLTFCR